MDPLQESKKFTHEGSDVAGLMAQEGDMKDRFAHVATQNPNDLHAHSHLKYHASGGGGEKEARDRPRHKKKKPKASGRGLSGRGLSGEPDDASGVELYCSHLHAEDASRKQPSAPKPRKGKRVAPGGGDAGAAAKARADAAAPTPPPWTDGPEQMLAVPRSFTSGGGGCFGGRAEEVSIPRGLAAIVTRKLEVTDAQLRAIRKLFVSVDADKSGRISALEFFKIIGAVDTPFVRVLIDRMIFDWADLNTDDQLSFEEFVLAACVVCTFTRSQILKFIFDIFDEDGSGTIGRAEFRQIAQCIVDLGGMFPGNYGSFLDQFDTSGDGVVDFSEFARVNETYPMLFFPAFKLQDKFQRGTLQPDTWRELVNRFDERDAVSRDGPAESLHTQMVELGLKKIAHGQKSAESAG